MMTKDYEAMPDYLNALEVELRAKASTETSAAPAHRQLIWRRPLIAVAAAAAIAIPVVVIAGSVGHEQAAYGQPAILDTPATGIPQPLKHGLALELAAGPDATLTQARPIPAFGDTAYLLSGDDAWCLSAPDPQAKRPDTERAVTCTRTNAFMRIGISLVAGNHYIAAIPHGVDNPTLTHADGTTETLAPNDQGVVTVDTLAPGDKVTLHGTDGQTTTDASTSS